MIKTVGKVAKPWMCPAGHVLGQTVRAEVNKRGRKFYVTRLHLYRNAIDMNVETPENVDVIAVLEGTVPVIECSICHQNRTWFIGEDAIEHLLEQRKRLTTSIV